MDYIIVPIALLFGFSLKSLFKKFNAKDHILLDQLFFYHMIMAFVFFNYITIFGGDAQKYWRVAKNIEFEHLMTIIISGKASPNEFMFLINYIPSNLLDLSFFSGCILYGILGYWAIVYLVVILKETFPLLYQLKRIKILNFSIFPTILFLPNFHFWSGGIGKDTLLFYCAGAFFYAVLNLKRRWYVLIPVVLIAYTIRPHILLFLLAGFAGALAFAPVLGNLGIIIRERNMFLPGFIIFAVAGLYNSRKFRKYEWWLKTHYSKTTTLAEDSSKQQQPCCYY